MRVLITGGAGHIGRAAAERLSRNGWDVRAVGVEPEFALDGVEYAQCDILNFDDLLNRMRGCDAVIHLAAIRAPQFAPAHQLFQINVAGTFNVFEAAAKLGIERVVQASSINALGCYYGTVDMTVRYLPVDEEHPTHTTDPYSFSKQMIEEIGAYFWRRDGISSAALRFPGVYSPGFAQSETFLNRRTLARRTLDELVSLPESEQRARIAETKRRGDEYRLQRPFDYHPELTSPPKPSMHDDPLFWAYLFDRFNLWAFIDVRDAAQSLEKAVTAEYEGAHALFVNDHHNAIGYDSRTLARLFFPEVSDYRGDLSGSSALVSIEKARALIGFEPEYSVAALEQP
jgi:nucleoside-diphosphate-sugar epimerase